MSRCLTSIALLFAASLWVGCAEEVEHSGKPVIVHDWIGETNPEFDLESVEPVELEAEPEPVEPSAARSIWNALLKGTVEAVE